LREDEAEAVSADAETANARRDEQATTCRRDATRDKARATGTTARAEVIAAVDIGTANVVKHGNSRTARSGRVRARGRHCVAWAGFDALRHKRRRGHLSDRESQKLACEL
jgi:hypothetical protein